MNVRELIEALSRYAPDDIVIIADGSEGASPLYTLEGMRYMAESTWYGEIKYRELTEKQIAQGYTEEDIGDGEDCVVLWPIN